MLHVYLSLWVCIARFAIECEGLVAVFVFVLVDCMGVSGAVMVVVDLSGIVRARVCDSETWVGIC